MSTPAENTCKALPERVGGQIAALAANAGRWHAMADAERAAVVRACRVQLGTLDNDWVAENMRCLGLEPSQADAYNIQNMDPFIFTSAIADRLDKIAERLEGKLKVPERDRQLPRDGPCIYKMGATGAGFKGVELELWANPGGDDTEPSTADAPGVGVVLGAGNQNFLTVNDVLELAFIHKKCVFLKEHPLRDFMDAPFKHLLAPLAASGAYEQCLDSQLAGAHSALVTHPSVTHVHMTGSGATHDRVRSALEAAGRENHVLFTSELGCVTPWIVCPGTEEQWQQSDIERHAAMLTGAFKSNCSMNCISPKVLVLPPEAVWPQRPQFLAALKQSLARTSQPPPFYPGAHQRYAAFEKEYPDAEKIEAPPSQTPGCGLEAAEYRSLGQDITILPSLLVDVGTIGEAGCRKYALQTEAFAPVLAIATVACSDPKEFPLAAARAVNEHVFGNLGCNVIYPDRRDETLDEMIRTLNYGIVSVNHWVALNYANPLGVWGGAPGSYKASAPASGLGFLGNLAQVPRPLRGVSLAAFGNKDIVMDKPMPSLLADILQVVIAKKPLAVLRIVGILVRRLCSLLSAAPPPRRR
ncbi:unnamed protein product [Prorocentrum cordatum]|uniref:Aldehyde dehydrogenase domain-containing protein n=1 Tax=Prorocentrum cordatum TaxID=2364126 RepID=A0ABN9PLC5_9DINO|nr:unnamed protein product [Polarella glacialis]